jgi:hypothetical protein
MLPELAGGVPCAGRGPALDRAALLPVQGRGLDKKTGHCWFSHEIELPWSSGESGCWLQVCGHATAGSGFFIHFHVVIGKLWPHRTTLLGLCNMDEILGVTSLDLSKVRGFGYQAKQNPAEI